MTSYIFGPTDKKNKDGICLSKRFTVSNKKFNFGSMAIPIAFINGLFFGGYALRKIRQYWEGGPIN